MKTRFNILLIPFIATGQEGEDIKHRKEKGIYELITSGIYSYSPVNTEGSFSSEVHFTYWFHFGPVIGVVRNKHTELNLGVHLGVEF